MSYTADSNEGRILLALRAGEVESAAINERFSNFSSYIGGLTRLRLVEKVGESFRLTEAGRVACPYRNPLAVPRATQAQEKTMPQGETKIMRQQVLAAIKAAGPAGVTRKALIERFDCSESNMDNHVMWLNREKPPVIVKPRLGLLVAAEFASAAVPPAAPPKIGEPARAPLANPVKTSGSPVDIDGVSLNVDHHEATDLSAAELALQLAQITPARYAVAFASDFHPTVEAAIAQAVRDYESDSLKQAVIVVCTPLGRIDVRPVFVPEAA